LDVASSIRFGPYELDVDARELCSATGRVRLQDQPFEILQLLLEHPGHVVTRDQIRERLWPAGTFVDFEHSLNAASSAAAPATTPRRHGSSRLRRGADCFVGCPAKSLEPRLTRLSGVLRSPT
jgi:hypothetical protein